MKRFLILFLIPLILLTGREGFDPEKDITVSAFTDKGELKTGDEFSLSVKFEVPEGYHITHGDFFYVDTSGMAGTEPEGRIIKGETLYHNEKVYKGTVIYLFKGIYEESEDHKVLAGYQICTETGDESCFMPVEKEVEVDMSGNADPDLFIAEEKIPNKDNENRVEQKDTAVTEDMTMEEKLASMLEGRSTWSFIVFLITFLGGILASLTPCVYPIIPVVISYMGAKSGNKKSAGFFLSLFFVLGLAVTYAVIGLLASFFSDVFGVGDFASNPVIRTVIAVIFFALALSMFGLWDMTLISSEQQTKMMQKGKEKKGVLGAFIIGMVSGIVAAPCVGPVLAMLLIHVANAGDVIYGSLIFITFALGMGMLFLVIGTFSGAISALPSSGIWMMKVKKIFGIIMTAAALYFLKIVIPENIFLFLSSIMLLMLSIFLGVFTKIDNKTAGFWEYTGKALGIFVFIIALIFSFKTISLYTDMPFYSAAGNTTGVIEMHIPFEKTDTDTEIVKRAVRSIKGTEKLVMVDLWAEWCSNCKELDKKTWNDPDVVEFADVNFIPIKLDFTKKDSDFSKKFIEEYREYGANNLPLILFIDGNGTIVEKLVGFIDAERMLKKMKRIIRENK